MEAADFAKGGDQKQAPVAKPEANMKSQHACSASGGNKKNLEK